MQEPQQTPADATPANNDSPQSPSPETAQPTLQEQLKQSEQKAQEHREAWLRALADADNIRKRAQLDVTNAHKYAIENFSTALVTVKDSLEAALSANNATMENLKSGVELTLKQLVSVFEKFNVQEIDPVGQKFDPHKHQAISTVASDAEPNSVVQVFQKGYLLHDRVIRPAMVSVAKAVEKA